MSIKKSKHDGMIRGFYHLKEAWYADANLNNRSDGLVDEINIGFYGPDGDQGTTGEFAVRWTELGGGVVPQLCVYDDAWEALTHFSDLLEEMAKLNYKNPSATDFCELLKRLGVKDLTPRDDARRESLRIVNEAHQTHRAVDHIDGDSFNSDPSNLRIVTLSENRR
jgi:hypothetical protein